MQLEQDITSQKATFDKTLFNLVQMEYVFSMMWLDSGFFYNYTSFSGMK